VEIPGESVSLFHATQSDDISPRPSISRICVQHNRSELVEAGTLADGIHTYLQFPPLSELNSSHLGGTGQRGQALCSLAPFGHSIHAEAMVVYCRVQHSGGGRRSVVCLRAHLITPGSRNPPLREPGLFVDICSIYLFALYLQVFSYSSFCSFGDSLRVLLFCRHGFALACFDRKG
jgi:hypothetical protein